MARNASTQTSIRAIAASQVNAYDMRWGLNR